MTNRKVSFSIVLEQSQIKEILSLKEKLPYELSTAAVVRELISIGLKTRLADIK